MTDCDCSVKPPNRLRFPNLGKPRTAGLCGRAARMSDCGLLSCALIERVNKGLQSPKQGMVRRKNSPLYDSFLLCRNSIRKDLSHIAHKRRNARFKGLWRVLHTPPRPLTAHTAAHTAKHGAFRTGGGITTLGAFCAVRKPCAAGYQNGVLCRFWALVGCTPKERRKPSGQRCAYARRCSEASRPRWAA